MTWMRALGVAGTLGLLIAVGCVADRPAAPGVYVLDDLGSGRWRSVSVGAEHGCALDIDGRAYCWGSNRFGQLGVDEAGATCGATKFACSLVPLPVRTGRTFTSISAGVGHTCAITTDSVPFCWGNNANLQLGEFGPSGPVRRIPGTVQMVSISAGATHSCGIRADSLLACWGSNASGAVGGPSGAAVLPTINSPTRFIEVDASDRRTCARTVARRVMCWGAAWIRTSGDTNYASIRNQPTFVAGAGAMSGVDAGPNSTCAFDASGFGWCWDGNLYGESGAGPGSGSALPRRIASDENFAGITVGAAHACAVTTSRVAFCWGDNAAGQLGAVAPEVCGRSRGPCSTRPLPVIGRQSFVSISAGLGRTTCGVTDRLNLYCWGAGESGQRGDGTRTLRSVVPRVVVSVHRQ